MEKDFATTCIEILVPRARRFLVTWSWNDGLWKQTLRQNALRMSTKFNVWTALYFRSSKQTSSVRRRAKFKSNKTLRSITERTLRRRGWQTKELKNYDEVYDDDVYWLGKDWNENVSFGGKKEP